MLCFFTELLQLHKSRTTEAWCINGESSFSKHCTHKTFKQWPAEYWYKVWERRSTSSSTTFYLIIAYIEDESINSKSVQAIWENWLKRIEPDVRDNWTWCFKNYWMYKISNYRPLTEFLSIRVQSQELWIFSELLVTDRALIATNCRLSSSLLRCYHFTKL